MSTLAVLQGALSLTTVVSDHAGYRQEYSIRMVMGQMMIRGKVLDLS